MGADLIAALSTMREKGQITSDVLFFNLQKTGIIPPDMTFEDFQARLDMEGRRPWWCRSKKAPAGRDVALHPEARPAPLAEMERGRTRARWLPTSQT